MGEGIVGVDVEEDGVHIAAAEHMPLQHSHGAAMAACPLNLANK